MHFPGRIRWDEDKEPILYPSAAGGFAFGVDGAGFRGGGCDCPRWAMATGRSRYGGGAPELSADDRRFFCCGGNSSGAGRAGRSPGFRQRRAFVYGFARALRAAPRSGEGGRARLPRGFAAGIPRLCQQRISRELVQGPELGEQGPDRGAGRAGRAGTTGGAVGLPGRLYAAGSL